MTHPSKKRARVPAALRDEVIAALKGHIDRLMDAAVNAGLTAEQTRTAAKEAAVNWSPPARVRRG